MLFNDALDPATVQGLYTTFLSANASQSGTDPAGEPARLQGWQGWQGHPGAARGACRAALQTRVPMRRLQPAPAA